MGVKDLENGLPLLNTNCKLLYNFTRSALYNYWSLPNSLYQPKEVQRK